MSVVLWQREAELLVALWNLRYLTRAQMHGLAYRDRSENAAKCRLTVLSTAGILERAETPVGGTAAWRLGRAGRLRLAQLRDGDFPATKPVSPHLLAHLLATNAVFLALASEEWVWSRLPFEWLGSHRAGLPFADTVVPPGGGVGTRRNRLLRPDALVTPRAPGAPRVFLELDRATEAITSTTERTNIRAKLEAYRTFLFGRTPDGRQSWYQAQFPDGRSAEVLFVVPATRGTSRRAASIANAAAELAGLHTLTVRVVTLDDVPAIRSACGLAGGAAPAAKLREVRAPPSIADRRVEATDVEALRRFYAAARSLYRGAPGAREALEMASVQVRALLRRLDPHPTPSSPPVRGVGP